MAEKNLKKQQLEYIGIGVLVIAAVFIGLTKFQKKEAKDEVFSREGYLKDWKEVEILEVSLPKEEKGIDYNVDVERPPFKSPFEEMEKAKEAASEVVVLPTMAFQGMIWKSVRPQAIIDNKVYDVGDSIYIGDGEAREEIKIKAITEEGIFLKYKSKEFIARPK